MTMPITTGAAMPTAGLRDHTESRTARQVNPSIGGSIVAQLRTTSRNASAAGMVWPDSPVRGWCPTMSTLEATVEAASTIRTTTANPAAVRVFAQKSCPRLAERVSTDFQVPCWSSLAKMSPATIAVSSGITHCAANPRTSSARANPFRVANRPNSVSFGGRDWPWMTTTTMIGSTAAPMRTALARYWARSLRTSHRSGAKRPGRRLVPAVAAAEVTGAAVVAVTARPASARPVG
jgi:hypothetical protein